MTEAAPARRLVILIALVCVLSLAACNWWHTPNVDARGEVTVINRTANAVTVTDTDHTFTVAGCGEASASSFRINAWTITGLGVETFRTGGRSFGPHAYVVVTVDSVPSQSDTRPSNLPACQGIPGRFE